MCCPALAFGCSFLGTAIHSDDNNNNNDNDDNDSGINMQRGRNVPLPRIRIPTALQMSTRARLRYVPFKTLQRRGNTAVFAAREVGSGAAVAVKVAPPDCSSSSQATAVYRKLGLSPHPVLLQSRAVFVDEGIHHIVLPWVPGGDLCDEVLGRGPFAEERARGVLRQLADALGHLHGVLGVAHLDLSPENVLLGQSGKAVLIDYGSCRSLAHDGKGCEGVAIKGQYAAPELLRALASGAGAEDPTAERAAAWDTLDLAKVDIFALGTVLFVTLFGFPPFRLALPQDLLWGALKKGGVRGALAKVGHSDLATSVSADVLSLLDGMLQPDPERRLSVAEIRSHPWLRFPPSPHGRVGG